MCNISKVYILITLFLLYLTCIRRCCVCEHLFNPINSFFKMCIILNSLIPYFIFSLTLMWPVVTFSQKYTGCNSRNGPDFGRVFLMLYYTDITQNTYIQSWTVWEIMTIENCGLPCGPRTIAVSWDAYLLVSLLAEQPGRRVEWWRNTPAWLLRQQTYE